MAINDDGVDGAELSDDERRRQGIALLRVGVSIIQMGLALIPPPKGEPSPSTA